MPSDLSRSPDRRAEIAAVAARLIADEGADWTAARRQAAHIVLGAGTDRRGLIPGDEEIEAAVREHLRTFAAATHPRLLAALRRAAVAVMERLATFEPYLTGAVLNGTATEHSDLDLELFVDSAKDVEVALLDAGLDYQALAPAAGNGVVPQEILVFTLPVPRDAGLPKSVRKLGVKLAVFEAKALRVAPRARASAPDLHPVAAAGRANLAMLKQLISETSS